MIEVFVDRRQRCYGVLCVGGRAGEPVYRGGGARRGRVATAEGAVCLTGQHMAAATTTTLTTDVRHRRRTASTTSTLDP